MALNDSIRPGSCLRIHCRAMLKRPTRIFKWRTDVGLSIRRDLVAVAVCGTAPPRAGPAPTPNAQIARHYSVIIDVFARGKATRFKGASLLPLKGCRQTVECMREWLTMPTSPALWT